MEKYVYYYGLKSNHSDLLYEVEIIQNENHIKDRVIKRWLPAASDKQAEHYQKAKRIITNARSTITRNNKKIDRIKTLINDNF